VFGGEPGQADAGAHGSVVGDELADHSDAGEPGHGEQVHGGFGVPGPHQHPAVAGTQREDVSGAAQLLGPQPGVGQCAHGRGAILGRHAGAGAGQVDRNGERGAVGVGVLGDHRRQAQFVGPSGGHGDADDAGRVTDHERHLLLGHQLGSDDQVALVLPVGVVGDHDHPAAGQRRQSPLHRLGRGMTAHGSCSFVLRGGTRRPAGQRPPVAARWWSVGTRRSPGRWFCHRPEPGRCQISGVTCSSTPSRARP
jgi:hypothetical protein